MSPLFFRRVAVAEAFTWAGLLVGMFLKYVTVLEDGSSLASQVRREWFPRSTGETVTS